MGLLEDTKDQVKAWQGLFGLIFGAIIACCFMLTQCSPPAPAPATPVLAKVNPEVKNEQKVEVPIATPKKTVKTYSAAAKNLIQLPKEILNDDTKYVTDSTSVPSSETPQTITQVLDVGTGETTTYTAPAPTPWLALEDRGQLTLDYGFKRGNSEPVARLNLRQDVLQIKQLHLGASASAYSDGDYFVGIGGGLRW